MPLWVRKAKLTGSAQLGLASAFGGVPGPWRAPYDAWRLSIVSAAHHLVRIAGDLRGETRRVHLQLHVRRASMVGTRRNLDVRVAVRTAYLGALGIALVVAHHHAEPDRRGELELVRRAAEIGRWRSGRVDRQHRPVGHVVRRAVQVGEEADVRLVVADVMAVVHEPIGVVRRDLRAPHLPKGLLYGLNPLQSRPPFAAGGDPLPAPAADAGTSTIAASTAIEPKARLCA